jgi:hypothetical protein
VFTCLSLPLSGLPRLKAGRLSVALKDAD